MTAIKAARGSSVSRSVWLALRNDGLHGNGAGAREAPTTRAARAEAGLA
jgi:hypothetical protein